MLSVIELDGLKYGMLVFVYVVGGRGEELI